MKYALHLSDKGSIPDKDIEKISKKWQQHSFYQSDLVLGLDIGIEGIGIWLRQGKKPVFAQTVLVELPTASPLKDRRSKRAQRRARVSLKKREAMLKEWIVKYGLLSKDRVEQIWENPSVFQRGFEHRYRAIQKKDALKSPEALVSCIRHCIQHRGFDYHLSNDSTFPWGDTMDEPGPILQWASRASCPESAVSKWKRLLSDAPWSDNETKLNKVLESLDKSVERYKGDPIGTHLKEHFCEKGHPNLREPARGENYPRELVKAHLRKTCTNHASMFGDTKVMDAALLDLLGESDQKAEPASIIDFHRKTQCEIEKLWERKTNDCPYLPLLADRVKKSALTKKCSPGSAPAIRRFKLLQFLAERTFVTIKGNTLERTYTPAPLFKEIWKLLEDDIAATTAKKEATKREKTGKKEIKSLVETKAQVELAPDATSHNKDFFDQLLDLLYPRLSDLDARASLSETAASYFVDAAGVGDGSTFDAAQVRANWKETYYEWRRFAAQGGPIYPQVELLLGNPRQYDDKTGKTKDANKGNPQEHGILRRLFAGQFVDSHGRRVDISAEIGDKKVPDAVIIETIGDIPRNSDQAKEIQKQQKEKRDAKDAIAAKYKLPQDATPNQIKRALLFDQQTGKDGRAICPFTGDDLGTDPLSKDLEVEHLYPREMGGISEMVNLALTKRQTNADKGKRTPFQVAGQTVGKTTFSQWSEMRKRAESTMRWNKTKRELFCREETTCPEWQNLTRTAQLARQLRDQIIRWLRLHLIEDDNLRSNTIAARIGTPSGAMTAACRRSWRESLPEFMRESKDRGNLRHHLYDAAVLSHIPPREGMNLTSCGGIFLSDYDPKKGWVTIALPGLLPDLSSFQASTEVSCLVYKPKNSKSKTARYDGTIYSPPDEHGIRWTRFKGTLADWLGDKKITLEKIKADIRAAGIPADKLPDKLIEKWYQQKGDTDHPIQPLRFPAFKAGVAGQKIETVTRKITKPCAEPVYGPHLNAKGEVIGWKVGQEAFVRCEIWAAPNPHDQEGILQDYYQRRVFHPRHIVNLAKRCLSDGRSLTLDLPLSESDLRELALHGIADEMRATYNKEVARLEKNIAQATEKRGKTGDLFDPASVPAPIPAPTSTLRAIYCEPKSIPTNAKIVGKLYKGLVLMAPINALGSIYKRTDEIPADGKPTCGWIAYTVSAIKSSGEIEMKLAERKKLDPEAQGSAQAMRESLGVTSNDDLAYLLELQKDIL